jgi:hypothetical protein
LFPLFGILKKHYQTDFSAAKFALVLGLVLLVVLSEYQFFGTRSHILKLEQWQRIPAYFTFYLSMSIAVLAMLKALSWKTLNISLNLIGVCICFSILCGIYQSYFIAELLKQLKFSSSTFQAMFDAVATKGSSIITIIIPSLVLYFSLRHKQDIPPFLGLGTSKWNTLKPYLQALLLCFVMIFISSFFSEISSYYPLYAKSPLVKNSETIGVTRWLAIVWFEFFYAFSFISVELLFRGVLLFLLFRYLKADALLMMASVYAIFHFGKPLVEVISSFFGGYILGVFALHSKNIWGGVLLHIGIAMFMECITSFM